MHPALGNWAMFFSLLFKIEKTGHKLFVCPETKNVAKIKLCNKFMLCSINAPLTWIYQIDTHKFLLIKDKRKLGARLTNGKLLYK